MKFKSSYGNKSKMITFFVFALVGFIFYSGGPVMSGFGLFLMGFLLLLFAYVFAISLRHVEVTDSHLRLVRWVGAEEFPLHNINLARELEYSLLFGSIRLFASGGLFGWIGIFRNRELGTYDVLANHSLPLIILRLSNRDRPFVFSADDVVGVLEALESKKVPVEWFEVDNTQFD